MIVSCVFEKYFPPSRCLVTVATETFGVLIAENEEFLRLGQQDMLSDNTTFMVLGTAGDTEALLAQVRDQKPNIIVLSDALTEECDCATMVQALRELSPKSAIVLMLSTPSALWGALPAKADAYCDRNAQPQHFRAALHAVSRGERFISPNLCEYLLNGDGLSLMQAVVPKLCPHATSELQSLSRREREVMTLLSEGKSNETIAKELGLSIQTVKVHVKHILKKLKVSDRTQAVIKALKHGVVA
jgi:DNA-binding NarL/FixJ family response regulator